MLNKEQLDVVDSNAKRLLCLAGAGTGKTSTLIARLQRLVSEGVDPRSMLVLTFTNAAAFEMARRYDASEHHTAKPKFGTFHSFCYGLIASDKFLREMLGYTHVPDVATEAQAKEVRIAAAIQLGFKLPDALKDDTKRSTLYAAADRLLKKRGLITFDKMCYDICNLFVHNNGAVKRYKEQYKYIFVDEAQDTDPQQHEFVMSFTDANIMMVGDALQNLYSFRGTTSKIIKELAEDSEWEVHRLSTNYRSTTQICQFANDMSVYANDAYRIKIEGLREGPDVWVIRNQPTHSQLNALPTIIQSDTAILCRTNAEVDEVSKFLRAKGIEFSTNRQPHLIINMCKAAMDEAYLLEWLASQLPAGMYENYIRAQSLTPYTLSQFCKQFYSCWQIRNTVQEVNKLNAALMREDADEIAAILKTTVPEYTSGTDKAEYLSKIIYAHSIVADKQGCYVGTVHSVKGLEFNSVIVLGVGGKSFRLNSEDNLNVYYVAITRAKDTLTVFKEGA